MAWRRCRGQGSRQTGGERAEATLVALAGGSLLTMEWA